MYRSPTNPSNGARMLESPASCRGGLLLRLGRGGRPLLRGARRGLPVVVGAGDGPRLEQVLHPLAVEAGLIELALGDLGLGRRGGDGEGRDARVDHGEDLAALDGLAALDERRHDLAAHVGRDVALGAGAQGSGEGELIGHGGSTTAAVVTWTAGAASRGLVAAAASSGLWQAASDASTGTAQTSETRGSHG